MSKLALVRRKNSMRRQLKTLKTYDNFLTTHNRVGHGLPGNDSIVFDLLSKRRYDYWLRRIRYV